MTPLGRLATALRGIPQDCRNIFAVGSALAATIAVLLAFSLVFSRELFGKLVGVLVANLLGGRTPAILTGLELHLEVRGVVFALILMNTCWLFIAFPLFVAFSRRATTGTVLARIFESAEANASGTADTLTSLGSWMLPLFVWLPFSMTGAFVGAVIGFMVGIPTRRLMYLVVGSMWIGVVSWTYGFEHLFLLTGLTGKVVTYVLTGVMLAYSLYVRTRRTA